MSAESLDALARLRLPPLVDETFVALAELPEPAQPHAVKPVRKQLGKLRDHLDLFAPVYPLAPDWRDTWAELRAAVDEGYVLLGRLKDLYDAQEVARAQDARYDPRELAARRAAVSAWRDRFLAPAHVERTRTWIARPAPGNAWRKRAGLSRRFWGTPGPRPDPEASGPANLARLSRYRWREARQAWSKAAKLPHLRGRDARERFHEARKRIRALVRLGEWFPELGAPAAPLVQLVSKQGKILDHLNGGREDEAEEAWHELRAWAKREEIGDLMRAMRRRH